MTTTPPADAVVHRTKPELRPARPHFSSGPCAKPPGWTADRSTQISSAARIAARWASSAQIVHRLMRECSTPRHPPLGVVPGSNRRVAMAMWTMLGARPVTRSPGKLRRVG